MNTKNRQRQTSGPSGPTTMTSAAAPLPFANPRPTANAWSRPLQQQSNRSKLVSTPSSAVKAGVKPSTATAIAPPGLSGTAPSSTANNKNNDLNLQISLRERFLHLVQNMVGQRVTLTQTNGTVLEGVFHTFTPFASGPMENRNKYVIKACKVIKESENGSKKIENGSTIIVPAEKVSQVVVKSIRIETNISGPKHDVSGQDVFQTDTDISGIVSNGKKTVRGDGLVAAGSAWTMPAHESISFSSRAEALRGTKPYNSSKSSGLSGSIGEWDQFRANEQLFSVRASFDENLYTTRLDKSQIDESQVERAERLARQIEGTATSNIHLAEERGQKVEGDFDEEDLYSGVIRNERATASSSCSSAWKSKSTFKATGTASVTSTVAVKEKASKEELSLPKKIVEVSTEPKPATTKSKVDSPTSANSTPQIQSGPQPQSQTKVQPQLPKKNYASVAAAAASSTSYAARAKVAPAVKNVQSKEIISALISPDKNKVKPEPKAVPITTKHEIPTTREKSEETTQTERSPDESDQKNKKDDAPVIASNSKKTEQTAERSNETSEKPISPSNENKPEPSDTEKKETNAVAEAKEKEAKTSGPTEANSTKEATGSVSQDEAKDEDNKAHPEKGDKDEKPADVTENSDEKKKPVSKLNANAKEFTFNPSAASFTPGSGVTSAAQPASETSGQSVAGATTTAPLHYMHHPQMHGGMVPMVNTQVAVSSGGMRYQNAYYGMGQPFPYHLPQHMQMQQQPQQPESNEATGERNEQQGSKQPEQAQSQQQVPMPYNMPPGVYYPGPGQQQAMMHPRGGANPQVGGFVPGQHQVMGNPHPMHVMPNSYSYRMYAPHMQQQPGTGHASPMPQQMQHPSNFYPSPNVQNAPAPGMHGPPPYVNMGGASSANHGADDNDRRGNRGVPARAGRRNGRKNGRMSGGGRGNCGHTGSTNPEPASTSSADSNSAPGSQEASVDAGSK